MATPYPAPVVAPLLDEARGLGIVHDDHVARDRDRLEILGGRLAVGLEHRLGDCFRAAVQRVVEGLGDLEERRLALDDVPARLDAEFAEERHHPIEQFGHTAPNQRRVDVLEPPMLDLVGRDLQFVDDLRADDRPVVCEAGTHACGSGVSASATMASLSSSSVRT